MKELQDIETTVNKLEHAAYRLDAFSQRLEEKINAYIQKGKTTWGDLCWHSTFQSRHAKIQLETNLRLNVKQYK